MSTIELSDSDVDAVIASMEAHYRFADVVAHDRRDQTPKEWVPSPMCENSF